MNLKKKKRALRILHDSEGFFIIHKNKKVRLTSASTLNGNAATHKNKLQNQVIVNNYLHRKARVKKTAPSGATKPTGPTDKASRHPSVPLVPASLRSDSDNFIRHSLVNQLEQLRHLQRNPPQHMPQSITVNPAINVHPANITVNNNGNAATHLKELHDPQTKNEIPLATKDLLKSGTFLSSSKGKEEMFPGLPPPTPMSLDSAASILGKLFSNSDLLNTLLNYADIKHGEKASADRMAILKKFPGLIGILQNSPSRSDTQKRSLAYEVTEYVKNFKGGSGKRSSPEGGGRGIYDNEIDEIMSQYTHTGTTSRPVYQGTFMRDELKNLKPAHKMAFIMNTDPSSKEGKHWVACYLDADHDKSLEYYDSFGKDPPKGFDRDMKRVVDELNLPYMLKYKVNRIIEQKSSDNCGFHAMRFLINRMKGNKFTEATKYNVLSAEAKAKSMREKFGFI